MELHTQRITPYLWFDSEAKEAAEFYTSIFKNSSIRHVSYFGSEGREIHQRPEGSVMTVLFEIEGMRFVALNGGPVFQFNEAVSFHVSCDSQEEIDYYWDRLSDGGDPNAQQCGWLKDRFGVSWQVVPEVLHTMLSDPDTTKSQRAMKKMLQMTKFDIAELDRAFNGADAA